MRFSVIAAFVACMTVSSFATQSVSTVITEVKDRNNKEFILIDINDKAVQKQFSSSISKEMQCFAQRDSKGEISGPILIPRQSGKFLRHSSFGKDLAIGTLLCAGGCIFVLAAGEENNGEPGNGFYANVGEKRVKGAPACFAGALWLGGCFFLGKGVLEIFTPNGSHGYDATPSNRPSAEKAIALSNTTCPVLTSAQILAGNKYTVTGRFEKSFDSGDYASLEKWLKRCCLSY